MTDTLFGGLNTDAMSMANSLRKLADDMEHIARFGLKDVKADVTISHWAMAKRAIPCLIGEVFGHPYLKDGNVSFTTEVIFIDVEQGLARTFSRWYALGMPLQTGSENVQ